LKNSLYAWTYFRGTPQQAHLNELAVKPLSQHPRGVYCIARSVLEEAYEKDRILRMPKIKLPKLEERAPRILETEQINFLVEASKTSKYHYGLWMELGTGLLHGMMLTLDGDDFNFKANTVTSNNWMVRENGGWFINPGAKTKAGAHGYDVPPVVMASLMKLAKPGKPMPAAVCRSGTGHACFAPGDSTPTRPLNWRMKSAWHLMSSKLSQHCIGKKIGDVRFHDLRHQFASFLKELGVHIFTIRTWPGATVIRTGTRPAPPQKNSSPSFHHSCSKKYVMQ
jgi:integrase